MKDLKTLPLMILFAVLASGSGLAPTDQAPLNKAPELSPAARAKAALTPAEIAFARCYNRGGSFDDKTGICKITETTQFSRNWNMGRIDTGVYVYNNDYVSVKTEGAPQVSIGAKDYGHFSFRAESEGRVILQGSEFNGFRLRSIQITRCYGEGGYGVACPSEAFSPSA